MEPDPTTQLYVRKQLDGEREKSDKSYAPIIIKNIVFGVIITAGTIAVTVLTYQVVNFIGGHLGVLLTAKP